MKEKHGMDKHLHDLYIGALQILAGMVVLALIVGFVLGKWVF